MPTYEYKCHDCGYTFEKFQGIKDDPLKKCPECNGKVQRLIGAGAGVIFKKSGSSGTDSSKNFPPSCGRDRPCCGRDTPCDNKSCEF